MVGCPFPHSFLTIFIHLMGPSGRSMTPKERLNQESFTFLRFVRAPPFLR